MSELKKQRVAQAAMEYVERDWIIGVGTGSTANCFIDELAKMKDDVDGAVASSEASAARLRGHGIKVLELNQVGQLPIYIDGADESTKHLHLIKGGGAALTREKIVAAASEKFICIADDSKLVDVLGAFPLPVEVIPMAQSYIGREIVKLGGRPVLRQGVTTDNGNAIIDIHDMKITNPIELEQKLNSLAGVVTNGIFAERSADVLLLAGDTEVVTITK